MRIGLLLSDFMPDEYLPIAGDYAEMFTELFHDRDVTLVPFEAHEGWLPDDPLECDAYVISGSRASVYEDEQWIRDLEEFVRASVKVRVPIFGVCFGLQVMATALGGVVEKSEGGWGGGVRTMDVDAPRSWMGDAHGSVSLIMSHQDQVTELPERATVLGSSNHCDNYLVEFTPIHIGIQGHPEFGVPFAEAIYAGQRERVGDLAVLAAASLSAPTDPSRVVDWILTIFDRS